MRNEDDEKTWLKIQHRGMYLAEKADELPNKTEQRAIFGLAVVNIFGFHGTVPSSPSAQSTRLRRPCAK
jgi:hypothetical protein